MECIKIRNNFCQRNNCRNYKVCRGGEARQPENPLDGMVRNAPFSAKMTELGAPVWFVVDKNDSWICQVTPSSNEQMARDIAAMLNKGAGQF